MGLCMWPFWIHWGSHIPSLWMVYAECVFVAGIQPPRNVKVRIFWVCVMECMCAQTRPPFMLSSKSFGEWGTSDTQMVTPLPSQFLVAFSAPTIELRYWLFVPVGEHLLESRKKRGNIAIFTDSLSTLQALNSADPDQMIQGLHTSLVKLTAQFTVSLQWVPVHVGLTGNEKADRLAKIGSQAPQTQNPVTYREAKTLLHSGYNGDWKKYNGGYQANLDPIWRLERAQQTTIFHLRTRHCGLSAHLKRIGISDTSLCECGQADQTPDHILQSCAKYAERRQLTWPQGADLVTKLWGLAEDLYRKAGFVASTGLKIWPARLSIAEEEEEEGEWGL